MSTWLLYANMTVWLGLGLYLLYISMEQRKIKARLASLEQKDE